MLMVAHSSPYRRSCPEKGPIRPRWDAFAPSDAQSTLVRYIPLQQYLKHCGTSAELRSNLYWL